MCVERERVGEWEAMKKNEKGGGGKENSNKSRNSSFAPRSRAPSFQKGRKRKRKERTKQKI